MSGQGRNPSALSVGSGGLHRKLAIAGADELRRGISESWTHLISIKNPGAPALELDGFTGQQLQLWFGDVMSEADAQRCRTRAPAIQDVQQAVEFFRRAWRERDSKILICCDYGASRSPAVAYVCVADQFTVGQEPQALAAILAIRPNAVPNPLVVKLGDAVLGRKGALIRPAKDLYSKINDEIAKWRLSKS